ncbi:uncharacterized protein LOC125236624 isoform X1 [Leguminivora glycinivorella]|uniref:uncharacterized protein LOC125236624 isoform X1 n=1 Tax=Leguminivora glycinivorella TaxID=1035111 RepID=UPI00200E2DFF|nr:uncharacterized protein LOC125236624 isoform X1 [Leguminivora glycinivorella]
MARIWVVVSLVLVAYLQVTYGKCAQHSECPEKMACESSQCVDPCLAHRKCGTTASCHVYEHLASCHCNPGTLGNPYESCSSSTYDVLTQGLAEPTVHSPKAPRQYSLY